MRQAVFISLDLESSLLLSKNRFYASLIGVFVRQTAFMSLGL